MAAGDGLVSMTPSSIAHSGTSASINADGGVDFTAVTSLSLNGVFTSDYDNYLVTIAISASNNQSVQFRLRAAGSDASGSNYTYQYLEANGSSTSAFRVTGTFGYVGDTASTLQSGDVVHLYGPALAQPTAFRSVNSSSRSDAYIIDFANTHSLSNAYDGFTVYLFSGNMTGNIHVFGYEE